MITLLFLTCVAIVVFLEVKGRVKSTVSIVGMALLVVLWVLAFAPGALR